jgi:hypothetical protein
MNRQNSSTVNIAEPQYTDYAFGKIALELCNHPHYMTSEGDEKEYGLNVSDGKYGYLGIHHPANITLDLCPPHSNTDSPSNIETKRTIRSRLSCRRKADKNPLCKEGTSEVEMAQVRQISVKFLDPNDTLNKTDKKGQEYAFRLLCSEDKVRWKVLFDSTRTANPYRVGWMHLKFRDDMSSPEGVISGVQQMRYFRIHALHNPVSSGFHVVRLRLFDREVEMPQGEEIILQSHSSYDYEINDTTPLATKMLNIAERLHRGVQPEDRTDEFYTVYNHVVEKAFELQAVDGKVDQVRKIITPLITRRMEQKKKESAKSTRYGWIASAVIFFLYIAASIVIFIIKCKN